MVPILLYYLSVMYGRTVNEESTRDLGAVLPQMIPNVDKGGSVWTTYEKRTKRNWKRS